MIQNFGKELISFAVAKQAQDLYLLPCGSNYNIFIRSGEKKEYLQYDNHLDLSHLISHFKFMAGMNVGEQRRPQLGSCDYVYDQGKSVALRLSSVGDYKGQESLVIRLLHDGQSDLKFWDDSDKKVGEAVSGRGLYLFSGPVGSGKTSLMYQLAKEKFSNQQIITIEDPVEIKQKEMLQLQLNESIGMTYDSLIKLSLRHRPDLLIIGEIRDYETARAVVRASLTGTTIFSTVHAKSIKGVYARLLELGVSESELKNSLQAIFYQRLIKGGGLVDVAKENFQQHSARVWNQSLEKLFDQGEITLSEKITESIKD